MGPFVKIIGFSLLVLMAMIAGLMLPPAPDTSRIQIPVRIPGPVDQAQLVQIEAVDPVYSKSNQPIKIEPVNSITLPATDQPNNIPWVPYPELVQALAALLADQDSIIRHHAVNALGEIGGEDALLHLAHARYDSHETIRANAKSILVELGYRVDYY